MAAAIEPFKRGDILYREVADKNGHKKDHPVLIISDPDGCAPEELQVGVVITTTFDRSSKDHIQLPWCSHGYVRTGLRRRSAAACRWIVTFDLNAAKRTGTLPASALLRVAQRISEIEQETDVISTEGSVETPSLKDQPRTSH